MSSATPSDPLTPTATPENTKAGPAPTLPLPPSDPEALPPTAALAT